MEDIVDAEFEDTPSERSEEETDTSADAKHDPPVCWKDLSRDQKRMIQNVRQTSVKLRRILSFDHDTAAAGGNFLMRDQTRSLTDLQKMVEKARHQRNFNRVTPARQAKTKLFSA